MKPLYGIKGAAPLPKSTNPPPDSLYDSLPNDDAVVKISRDYCFDALQWLKFFGDAKNHAKKRALRNVVQAGTLFSSLAGSYLLPDGTLGYVDMDLLQESVSYTAVYRSDAQFQRTGASQGGGSRSSRKSSSDAAMVTTVIPSDGTAVEISVVRGDCIDVALRLIERYRNVQSNISNHPPLVLVNASRTNPGGAYRRGANAQEENICRRTTLFHNLEDPYDMDPSREALYPIPEFGGIYSPNVQVLRASQEDGYAFMDDVETLAFVNIDPYVNPQTEVKIDRDGNSETRVAFSLIANVRRKIEMALHIARENNHKMLVLGAWGCGGAFNNPPKHMAEMFKAAIFDQAFGFADYFAHISFAIPDESSNSSPKNSATSATSAETNGNGADNSFCKAFADAFCCDILELDDM
ncbi:hypothetical protein GQ42DRAFT_73641 [Ramicandelaber brevisporus]|nr:hypothetical protein GQ42DRAFT_73641 [Ramicandelaber brevisporus]